MVRIAGLMLLLTLGKRCMLLLWPAYYLLFIANKCMLSCYKLGHTTVIQVSDSSWLTARGVVSHFLTLCSVKSKTEETIPPPSKQISNLVRIRLGWCTRSLVSIHQLRVTIAWQVLPYPAPTVSMSTALLIPQAGFLPWRSTAPLRSVYLSFHCPPFLCVQGPLPVPQCSTLQVYR